MIRRARADARGHLRSAARAELVGVDARLEARAPCRPRESRVDSSGVKTPVSQNTSHHSASPAAATAGIISSTTSSHVLIAARCGYSSGTSCAPMKVGDDVDRVLARRARRSARSIFSSDSTVEAVTALDLAGRRAAGEHLVEPRRASRATSSLFDGRARRGDGRHDAAAGGGDFGVGRAGEPPPQLVAPVAGEDCVGVRDRRIQGRSSSRVRRRRGRQPAAAARCVRDRAAGPA